MARDSSGNRLAWLKLWCRDFMADPAVQALTWEQRGRYLWALMCSWETDEPGQGTENDWARWLGFTTLQWHRAKVAFQGLFETGALWVQKRLRAEYLAARADADSRSESARTAARMRWQSDRNAPALRLHSERNASGMPSSSSSSSSSSKPKPTHSRALHSARFDEFWAAYPKKQGRKPCLAKWVRLGADADDLFAQIMAGLKRLLPTWTEVKFVPNPLTFLNQERWSDEPIAPDPEPDDGWRVTR